MTQREKMRRKTKEQVRCAGQVQRNATRGPSIAHLSKQARGQTYHLNKPDYWLKVKG